MEIHPATGPSPEDRGRSGAKGDHLDGHRFDTPRTGQEGKGPSRPVPGLELPASRETSRPGLSGGCATGCAEREIRRNVAVIPRVR